MKDPRDIIKRPVITENSADLMAEKKYTFEVSPKANKTEIKSAIELVFGVKVEKVNTMNLKGKFKRMGKYGGFRSDRKKAIVQLSQDSKELDFFEGVE
ncbi:50S ribosomal protein L23 [Radiobacillus sp. PE A8.2]|uniref:50S ribosomal protein L23 n=1 Tax=Radiobacillus sp. PE A8.2 TaxID=3380349 RepID=UPI00388EF424